MVSYSAYRDTVAKIHTAITEHTLKPLAKRHFKHTHGYSITEVLPDKTVNEYTYTQGPLTAHLNTDTQSLHNPQYDNKPITVNSIAENPTKFHNLIETLHDAWFDTFGEITQAHQPNHPGEPPFSINEFNTMLEQLEHQWNTICADPTVDDLLNAITDKNYRLAMRFLGADNPTQVLDPTSGHELYNLFSNGDISVVLETQDFALLKPEYNHETRAEIIAQQRNSVRNRQRGGRVVARTVNNPPEEAFVIGADDTPDGLFIHSIDGTQLTPTQEVSKTYVEDIMGFDRHYRGQDQLRMNIGERVRLQGDLAVEYVSSDAVSTGGRCPIPIDNHYAALDSGVLPQDEDKTEEPITVRVPNGAYLNVAHDEHENVAVELKGGEYRFYLLERGLQREAERPQWNETEM